MRRLTLILALLALLGVICTPVYAATGVSDADLEAYLDRDGSCEVTIRGTLCLDEPQSLYFPVPENARGISLNGDGVSTRRGADCLEVDLSKYTEDNAGEIPFTLRYTVPNTVTYTEKGHPQLNLPLLSGFVYPMDGLEFTIKLPEDVVYNPVFISGYHQQSISGLDWDRDGREIVGSITQPLKDHETLSMTLRLTEKTFPRNVIEPWSAGLEDTLAFVLMGLSALYWLIFLRCAPLIRRRSNLPPEGSTAGELRCALTGQGADLTMMVMSWAQLGYILIHIQENGRVLLYKRMEMGNERGSFENKVFRSLFSKKRTVDGSGYHYARLCRKVAAARGSLPDLFRRKSGNPLVFRLLAAGAGVFSGASLAIALAGDALLAILIILIMSLAGGAASWLIQDWVQGLHLRGRGSLILGLTLGAGWILLGILAGEAGIAIAIVAFELLAGLACAYGGRRTHSGRHTSARILGFRAYLKRIPSENLAYIRRNEPDYFFNMAPYALALGVEKAFARQFGRTRLNPCSWLTTGMDGHMTAPEWIQVMRRAANSLDETQRRLPWEQLLGR